MKPIFCIVDTNLTNVEGMNMVTLGGGVICLLRYTLQMPIFRFFSFQKQYLILGWLYYLILGLGYVVQTI